MKYLTSSLLLLLLSLPAAAATETVFLQKQALIERLVSSEPKKMAPGIQKARADIRALQAKAGRLYQAGDLEQAAEVQGEAFALAVKLRSQLGDSQAPQQKSLQAYRGLLSACGDYIALLRQEPKAGFNTDKAAHSLARLKTQATASQWQAAWPTLESLHDELALTISRVLDKQERTVELKLDTPEQQYAYEVRIYDGLLILAEQVGADLEPASASQLKQQLQDADKVRRRALALEKNKQMVEAVAVMEDANLILRRGVRILGINLP